MSAKKQLNSTFITLPALWHRRHLRTGAIVASMAAKSSDSNETLPTALDHAWHWYEFRYGQATQLMNFYMVGIAVLTTGYVTAIDSRLYGLAGAVGLIAAAMSLTTFLIGERLRSSARLAAEPLAIIQGRLAESLGIQELRIVERHRSQNVPMWKNGTVLPPLIAGVALAVCIGASFYAWLGHLPLTSSVKTARSAVNLPASRRGRTSPRGRSGWAAVAVLALVRSGSRCRPRRCATICRSRRGTRRRP